MTNSQLNGMEKMVVSLETTPWDSLYRAIIGACLMPAFYRVFGVNDSVWKLFAFFLAVLVALRLVPGMLRRVLPFSREVKSIWGDRRALARRYDSYQWRKLFGLGLGWLVYLFVAGETWPAARFLAGTCFVAGVMGMIVWIKRSKAIATQAGAGAPVSASA
jgi:hypothetical protein